jgi:hypothetical protein
MGKFGTKKGAVVKPAQLVKVGLWILGIAGVGVVVASIYVPEILTVKWLGIVVFAEGMVIFWVGIWRSCFRPVPP